MSKVGLCAHLIGVVLRPDELAHQVAEQQGLSSLGFNQIVGVIQLPPRPVRLW